MITAMIEAAKAARQASADDGSQRVTITVQEDGFAIEGVARLRGENRISLHAHVAWAHYDIRPGMLANAVRLLGAQLRAGKDRP